jgi:hypothetical protein
MSKPCPYQDKAHLHSLPCHFQRHPDAEKQHLYFCTVCEKICDTTQIKTEEKTEELAPSVLQLLAIASMVVVGLLAMYRFEQKRPTDPLTSKIYETVR